VQTKHFFAPKLRRIVQGLNIQETEPLIIG